MNNITLLPEVVEARKALVCLYIAVDESVAENVNRKVEAAFLRLQEIIDEDTRQIAQFADAGNPAD